MAIGDLYKVTMDLDTPDTQYSLGFGFKQTAGTNDHLTLQSAIEFFQAQTVTEFLACFPVTVVLDKLQMVGVEPGGDIPGIVQLVGLPGIRAGEALPAGGAAVVSWGTVAPNSKFNGRTYLAGTSELDVVGGNLTAPQITRVETWAAQMQLTLQTTLPQTAQFEFNVISRFLDGAPRATPIGFAVTGPTVRAPLFNQRRRITKRRGFQA